MKGLIISLATVIFWQSHAQAGEVNTEEKATLNSCSKVEKADVCGSIDAFFALIGASVDDSKFNAVNQFLIPFKKDRCGMLQLLRSLKTINGVQNTTPLHVAAKGNNLAISAIFFQKLSAVTTSEAEYQDISHSLGNARDNNNNKPINYTDDPNLIDLLSHFTDN